MASSSEAVTRAISIASEIKRKRLKESLEREELMQFVDYPGRAMQSGPDGERDKRVPPNEIRIYLSRIPLEELVPKAAGNDGVPVDSSLLPGSDAGPSSTGKPTRNTASLFKPPLPQRNHRIASNKNESDSGKKKSFWQKAKPNV